MYERREKENKGFNETAINSALRAAGHDDDRRTAEFARRPGRTTKRTHAGRNEGHPPRGGANRNGISRLGSRDDAFFSHPSARPQGAMPVAETHTWRNAVAAPRRSPMGEAVGSHRRRGTRHGACDESAVALLCDAKRPPGRACLILARTNKRVISPAEMVVAHVTQCNIGPQRRPLCGWPACRSRQGPRSLRKRCRQTGCQGQRAEPQCMNKGRMNRQLECVRAKTENAETLRIEPWNCGIAPEWPECWPRGERTEHCAVEAAPRNLAAGSGVAGHYDGVARGWPCCATIVRRNSPPMLRPRAGFAAGGFFFCNGLFDKLEKRSA